MRQRRSPGFTLIEILVVVAILGIIVAIAVVNYLNAIGRARQRRSMSDMRSLATAIEAYAADLDRYPPASAFTMPPDLDLPTLNLQNARPYLQPTYMKTVPMVDGWNSWFLYGTSESRTDYALSAAAQGGAAADNALVRSDDRLHGRHHPRERAVRSVARGGPEVMATGGSSASGTDTLRESRGGAATNFVGDTRRTWAHHGGYVGFHRRPGSA